MYQFGKASMRRRATLHKNLIILLDDVIQRRDFTIVDGWRGMKNQNDYFDLNKSTKQWPDSKHNRMIDSHGNEVKLFAGIQPIVGKDAFPESTAADIAPYIAELGGICWEPRQISELIGYVRCRAEILDIPIRWGGDWDGDLNMQDQRFNDLPHIELIL